MGSEGLSVPLEVWHYFLDAGITPDPEDPGTVLIIRVSVTKISTKGCSCSNSISISVRSVHHLLPLARSIQSLALVVARQSVHPSVHPSVRRPSVHPLAASIDGP